VIGTEEAWALSELPRRIAVVGAGASGAEIASAYARLGTEVMLFEALDRVLPTEDADISKLAERGLKKQGMQIFTKTFVQDVETGADSVSFTYNGEKGEVDWLCPRPRRASGRSATSSPGRRWPTRPPTRASSPSRTPPGWRRTRSATRTSPAPRSARRTSRASGSPSSRRATPATTSSSARSSTGPSAPAPCTATAPG
jgi:hypothetical protein